MKETKKKKINDDTKYEHDNAIKKIGKSTKIIDRSIYILYIYYVLTYICDATNTTNQFMKNFLAFIFVVFFKLHNEIYVYTV